MKFPNLQKSMPVFALAGIFLCLSGCMDLAANDSKNKLAAMQSSNTLSAQVYTMRGLGGIFSRGMNRLEDTLRNRYRIRTSSTIWYKAEDLSRYIIAHYKSGEFTGPIVLIGHSLGANEQIKVGHYLNKANIPVALLITIDAVSPLKVSANVKEALNIYKPGYAPMFSGLKLKALNPEATRIVNLNVESLKEVSVNHFTIDKHAAVQALMLKKVMEAIKANQNRGIAHE